MRIVGIARFLILWALQALSLGGCGDSTTEPREPDVPTGTIFGTVRNGGAPIDATVRATRVDLPDRGGVRYDVVSAFACHVIGPVAPTMWKLTASFRPSNSGLTKPVDAGPGIDFDVGAEAGTH